MHELATNTSENLTALALVITSLASLVAAFAALSGRSHAKGAQAKATEAVDVAATAAARATETAHQLDRHYERVESSYHAWDTTQQGLLKVLEKMAANHTSS